MNWYFEKAGVSQGPVLEHDMAGRVQRGDIQTDTLVWHQGMSEWQPIEQVAPDWVKPKPAPLPPAKPAGKVSPTTKPRAPSQQAPSPAATIEEKQGLLSRWFGRRKP